MEKPDGLGLWDPPESDTTEATQRQQQQRYSILANYCNWNGEGITALLEMSDHSVLPPKAKTRLEDLP